MAIVVLSNKDECVLARADQAKNVRTENGHAVVHDRAADPLGPPHEGGAGSSIDELYAELSGRVIELLGRYSDWQQVRLVDGSLFGVDGDVAERRGPAERCAPRSPGTSGGACKPADLCDSGPALIRREQVLSV